MSGSALTLEQADESALPYIEARLEANELPSEDVRGKAECFYTGYSGENQVGIGGVENYGAAGLLRSVVVEEGARGKGVGTAMCEALETQARSDRVETLYLLTTTASEFFADRGYLTT